MPELDELLTIREAVPGDAAAIARIYNPYVRETTISFEESEIDAAQMADRMREVAAAGLPWLVAIRGGAIVGYAAAGKWKARAAYRFSVETTVYAAMTERGRGVGRSLYEALFARLRGLGVHAVIGGIALPNEASVALHERMGMRKVAHFEQVGFKFGRWIDVGYWELVLPAPSA
jgi:phosphinothricin acetyltransferase